MSRNSIKAALVLDARNGTGESPVWHAAEQALYWVDIPVRKLCRWTPATGQLTRWLVLEMLACVAMTPAANTWIAGAESGVFQLELQNDGQMGFERLAPVEHTLTMTLVQQDEFFNREKACWAKVVAQVSIKLD